MVFLRQDSSPHQKAARFDLGFGYKFLLQFCAFCGHSFGPISGWRAYPMIVHQVVANLATASFLVLGSYNLYITYSHFSAFLYFCVGFLTIAESVLRTVFVIAR
jgi:hypothetical protein